MIDLNFVSPEQYIKDHFQLKQTDPRHFNLEGKQGNRESAAGESGFRNFVLNALGEANSLQQQSTQLSTQYITDPESVNVNDVVVAMAKANLTLSMTKSVVDNAVKAYKEIISIR